MFLTSRLIHPCRVLVTRRLLELHGASHWMLRNSTKIEREERKRNNGTKFRENPVVVGLRSFEQRSLGGGGGRAQTKDYNAAVTVLPDVSNSTPRKSAETDDLDFTAAATKTIAQVVATVTANTELPIIR